MSCSVYGDAEHHDQKESLEITIMLHSVLLV